MFIFQVGLYSLLTLNGYQTCYATPQPLSLNTLVCNCPGETICGPYNRIFYFNSLQKRNLARLKRLSWMPIWRIFWSELRTPSNGQKGLWSRQKSYYSPTQVRLCDDSEWTDKHNSDILDPLWGFCSTGTLFMFLCIWGESQQTSCMGLLYVCHWKGVT